MPRLGKAVDGLSVTIRSMGIGIAVGMDVQRWASVAKIPGLVTRRRTEGSDFEGHGITRLNAKRRRVAGMDRWRKIVRLPFLQHLNYGEVIVRVALGIGNLQDLAISSGFLITALDLRTPRGSAVAESPFVSFDLPG